ncbi:MAG: transglutaminase domain-containing protein [Phycisphaerales bacterium]|nr:transglutaminase domain-containing protein [Phycisphaerales bacterium]
MQIRPAVLAATMLLPWTACTHEASAQHNPSDPEIILPENPYLSYRKAREWEVHQTVYLLVPQTVRLGPENQIQHEIRREDDIFPSKLEFVFPVMQRSGSGWTTDEKVHGTITLNDQPEDMTYTIQYAPGTNAPYAVWDLHFRAPTSVIRFENRANIVAVDTVFDEQKALGLGWPTEWPDEPARFLTPIIDPIGQRTDPLTHEVLPAPDETVIKELITQWTEGNDPKSIPPVTLAKYLAARVIGHMKSNDRSLITTDDSTFRRSLTSNIGPGNHFDSSYTGFYAGFAVRDPEETTRTGRGSRHDMTLMLTAVYRAAGLPARTVIGIDDDGSGTDRVRSWTEFALYDPALDLTVWIPVDIDQLRRRGASTANYTRPWKFFGTNDELHAIAPVSFYFHPPAAYQSFQVPALYGIRSDADLPYFAEQIITFGINRKPVRGGQTRDNQPKP